MIKQSRCNITKEEKVDKMK